MCKLSQSSWFSKSPIRLANYILSSSAEVEGALSAKIDIMSDCAGMSSETWALQCLGPNLFVTSLTNHHPRQVFDEIKRQTEGRLEFTANLVCGSEPRRMMNDHA